jgi:hypothetical protein
MKTIHSIRSQHACNYAQQSGTLIQHCNLTVSCSVLNAPSAGNTETTQCKIFTTAGGNFICNRTLTKSKMFHFHMGEIPIKQLNFHVLALTWQLLYNECVKKKEQTLLLGVMKVSSGKIPTEICVKMYTINVLKNYTLLFCATI